MCEGTTAIITMVSFSVTTLICCAVAELLRHFRSEGHPPPPEAA